MTMHMRAVVLCCTALASMALGCTAKERHSAPVKPYEWLPGEVTNERIRAMVKVAEETSDAIPWLTLAQGYRQRDELAKSLETARKAETLAVAQLAKGSRTQPGGNLSALPLILELQGELHEERHEWSAAVDAYQRAIAVYIALAPNIGAQKTDRSLRGFLVETFKRLSRSSDRLGAPSSTAQDWWGMPVERYLNSRVGIRDCSGAGIADLIKAVDSFIDQDNGPLRHFGDCLLVGNQPAYAIPVYRSILWRSGHVPPWLLDDDTRHDVIFRLGVAYSRCGRLTEAKQSLREACKGGVQEACSLLQALDKPAPSKE